MSVRALSWAFDQDIPTTEKFVLVALADHVSADGWAWPRVKVIMKKTSLSEASVRAAIGRLVERGALIKEARSDSEGRQMSNVYFVVMGEDSHDVDPHGPPDRPRGVHQIDPGGSTRSTPRTTTS